MIRLITPLQDLWNKISGQHESLKMDLKNLELHRNKIDIYLKTSLRMIFLKILLHFKTEEDFMRISKYPSYNLHKKEHDRLLDEIDQVLKEKSSRANLREILEEAIDKHIASFDHELEKWIENEHI